MNKDIFKWDTWLYEEETAVQIRVIRKKKFSFTAVLNWLWFCMMVLWLRRLFCMSSNYWNFEDIVRDFWECLFPIFFLPLSFVLGNNGLCSTQCFSLWFSASDLWFCFITNNCLQYISYGIWRWWELYLAISGDQK